MFLKDRNDSSLEQHRGVRLGLKNVRIWVKDIVENRSMYYEEAGSMVRLGKVIDHRAPPGIRRTCWKCGKDDHSYLSCTVSVICGKCKKHGHMSKFCNDYTRNRAKNEKAKKMYTYASLASLERQLRAILLQ
jgi:hypothetical protein